MNEPLSRYNVTVTIGCDVNSPPDPAVFAVAADQAAWARSASIISVHLADKIISVVTVTAPDRSPQWLSPGRSYPTRSTASPCRFKAPPRLWFGECGTSPDTGPESRFHPGQQSVLPRGRRTISSGRPVRGRRVHSAVKFRLATAIAAAGVCATHLVWRHEDCDSSWSRGSGSISKCPWWADRHEEVMQEARPSSPISLYEWGHGSQNRPVHRRKTYRCHRSP